MDNTGKYVLLTGATTGIGFELAKLFAKNKYHLVIVARDENELGQAAIELKQEGVEVIILQNDLFEPQAAFEVYEEIERRGINIDILVNNAAQGVFGKFIENDLERELKIVQLNIASLLVLTKLFIKDMAQRGSGKILNVASIAGKMPGPYQAVYHGTKAFVHSFTEAVRSEMKETGVTLTSLLPGPTDTDFFKKADMESSKIVQEGEMADPAKVAKDGYEALMAGEAKVISGLKNKMQVAMGNVLPDSTTADRLKKQQKPVGKE